MSTVLVFVLLDPLRVGPELRIGGSPDRTGTRKGIARSDNRQLIAQLRRGHDATGAHPLTRAAVSRTVLG